MGRRLVIGILKGLLLGGAVGALLQFALPAYVLVGWVSYLTYGLLGALAGALAGRAPWKPGAWIEGVLKGIFGLAVGMGLYALAVHFLQADLPAVAGGVPAAFAHQPLLFAPALAMVYGTLVELDNSGESDTQASVPGVRVDADKLLASIPDEDEAPAARQQSAGRKHS